MMLNMTNYTDWVTNDPVMILLVGSKYATGGMYTRGKAYERLLREVVQHTKGITGVRTGIRNMILAGSNLVSDRIEDVAIEISRREAEILECMVDDTMTAYGLLSRYGRIDK